MNKLSEVHSTKSIVSFVISVLAGMVVVALHVLGGDGLLTTIGIGIGLTVMIMQALQSGYSHAAWIVANHIDRLRK